MMDECYRRSWFACKCYRHLVDSAGVYCTFEVYLKSIYISLYNVEKPLSLAIFSNLILEKLKPKPTMVAKQCIVIVRHSNPRGVSLPVTLSDFTIPFSADKTCFFDPVSST